MKIILQIIIVFLFIGCSNVNKVNKSSPLIDLVVKEDKYSLILKHHFYKNFKTYNSNLVKFTVETNLSFNTSDALSNNGSNNLKIVKGRVDFKIFNNLKTKVIKSGSISSTINTGNVTSLYSIEENNNFAKEKIAKFLASKLYGKILLNIKQSES